MNKRKREMEEKPEGEAAEGEAAEPEVKEEKPEEEKKPEIDIDVDEDLEVDVWEPKDVDSIDGKGSPLYKQFTSEDWLLVQMRFELHHLVKAFSADATSQDPERRGIAPSLLGWYYQIYFSKPLFPPAYGMESQEKLLSYCEDTVKVQDGVLTCIDEEDVPVSRLVRVVEDARRDRVNRVAAGDESAKLVFPAQAPPAAPYAAKRPAYGVGGGKYGAGGKGGFG